MSEMMISSTKMTDKEERKMAEKTNNTPVEITVRDAKRNIMRLNKYAELVKKNLKDKEARKS